MPPHSAPILVIEGHCDVRVALQLALDFVGYEVRTTANAREARTELERMVRPGLLLLDEALPERERAEFIQYVREEPSLRSLPIVLLSLDENVRPSGIQAVLRKPFTLDRLYAVVKEHCEVRDVPRARKGAGRPGLSLVPAPREQKARESARRLGA